MRKILLFTLMLFTFGMASAQSFYTTYKVRTGKWNEYRKEYVYAEPYAQNIKLEFNGNVIRVYDRENSVYITKDQKVLSDNEKLKMYGWDAIDEGSRRCRIVMSHLINSGEIQLSVLYGDLVYEYSYLINKN